MPKSAVIYIPQAGLWLSWLVTGISKEAQIAIVASHQLALGYRGVDTSPGSAARQGSTQLQGNRMTASITEGLGVSDVPQEHSGGLTLQENQDREPGTGSDPGRMAPLPYCTAHLPG